MTRRRYRQLHAQSLRATHHVRVRNDVTVGIDDDAGAGCALRRYQIRCTWDHAVTREKRSRENFHYRRTNYTARAFERTAQVGGVANRSAPRLAGNEWWTEHETNENNSEH